MFLDTAFILMVIKGQPYQLIVRLAVSRVVPFYIFIFLTTKKQRTNADKTAEKLGNNNTDKKGNSKTNS
jgi:mannitol-specific phosphotransferase system IIBC component